MRLPTEMNLKLEITAQHTITPHVITTVIKFKLLGLKDAFHFGNEGYLTFQGLSQDYHGFVEDAQKVSPSQGVSNSKRGSENYVKKKTSVFAMLIGWGTKMVQNGQPN